MAYTFKELYRLTKVSQGNYTIRYSQIVPYTVADYTDRAGDNLTILGDVANDHFTLSSTHTTNNVVYGGKTTNNGIIIKAFGYYYLATQRNYSTGATVNSTSASFTLCFAAETRIRTTRGEVPVEHLAVGDLVVTAAGAARPIRWLGKRRFDGGVGPLPTDQQPVRVRRGAFGHDKDGAPMPARDLRLSPGHPVLVGADSPAGGVLVPIMCLINGTTIAREPLDAVTYWHVELDGHDILLAEGLPVESYIDLGTRAWFDGADGALHHPDLAMPGQPGRCRPVAVDGPLVEMERRRLDQVFAGMLAAQCTWPDAATLPQ